MLFLLWPLMGPGQLEVDVTVEANLHAGEIGKPLSLAPDAWFGVTDHLTLGVIHSGPAIDRFEPGASACLVTCDHFYERGGVDGLWRLGEHVAARARFLLRGVDPVKPAVTLGAVARWGRGAWTITADPYVQLGLANQAHGNRAELFLPVALTAEPACGWAIDFRTGFNSDFAVIDGGGWYVPVYLGTRARVAEHVEVGAAVGFFSLFGPLNNASDRTLFVSAGITR